MDFKQIAQKIVDITMEEINDRNINIMNMDGYIIASGDKNRIDTYHKGAEEAIQTGRSIEIYPDRVGDFPGAKEGVNMPINIHGKIFGVVGVSGHPDEVRMIARLVKKLVESAIEQHLNTEEINLIKDLKQQLIRNLIYSDIEEKEEQILCLAKNIGIDLSQPRYALIFSIEYENDVNSIQVLKDYDKIEQMLIYNHFIDEKDFYGVINQYFVLFESVLKDREAYLRKIDFYFKTNCKHKLKITVGCNHDGLSGYKKSFIEAKKMLRIQKNFPFDLNDINLQTEYMLNEVNVREFSHFFEPICHKLMDSEGNVPNWVGETLNALFDNNLNMMETAKSLYIHKNTLLYRIKKIEQMTGLSINNSFYHSVFLKLFLIYLAKKESN